MKKILIVIGTRPNFIKVTRFRQVAMNYPGLDLKFVHTGQHFDERMSKIFFEQFGLSPDFFLEVGQGTPNSQMANIMLGLEGVCSEFRPDLMMVVGDVNSTFAAALSGNKMGIKVAHLESGLRSFDRGMPEEINRILTDEIADYFFVTEQSGMDNLLSEDKQASGIFMVGNTMIDSLVAFDSQVQNSKVLEEMQLSSGAFVLMTMHRPANVDEKPGLEILIRMIQDITSRFKLVFPIHPRTVARLKQFGLWQQVEDIKDLLLCEPLDYFSFQKLTAECRFVVTDSGGIQEETTFRGVPCLTLRDNTERPVTVDLGTNVLVPYTPEALHGQIEKILDGTFKKGQIPPLWDGKSTERVVEIINRLI